MPIRSTQHDAGEFPTLGFLIHPWNYCSLFCFGFVFFFLEASTKKRTDIPCSLKVRLQKMFLMPSQTDNLLSQWMINKLIPRGLWVAQLVKHLTLDLGSGHDLMPVPGMESA